MRNSKSNGRRQKSKQMQKLLRDTEQKTKAQRLLPVDTMCALGKDGIWRLTFCVNIQNWWTLSMSMVKKKKSTPRPMKSLAWQGTPVSETLGPEALWWNAADWVCLRRLPQLLLLFSCCVQPPATYYLCSQASPVLQCAPSLLTHVHWVGGCHPAICPLSSLLSSSVFPTLFFYKNPYSWILQPLMHLSLLCCCRPLFPHGAHTLCLFPKSCWSSRLHPWQWFIVNL